MLYIQKLSCMFLFKRMRPKAKCVRAEHLSDKSCFIAIDVLVSPLSPMSTSSSDAPLSEVPSFNVHSEEQADHLNVSNEEILPAPVDHQLDDRCVMRFTLLWFILSCNKTK